MSSANTQLLVIHFIKVVVFTFAVFRERPCQNQRIGDRNYDQYAKMEEARFHSKVGVICKGAERVDGGVNEDTGQQAAAAIKDRDQQEADRDGKDDLAQVIDKIHAAAVEQIDDMPNTKGHAGNHHRRFDIGFCHGGKQKPSENHLFQKANAEHAPNAAGCGRRGIVEGDTVP